MDSLATQDTTVRELAFYDVQVGDETPGAEIARLFERNNSLPGVMVMRGKEFCGMVSRNQFFHRLARPFGLEIYSPRAITAYLDNLNVPALVLPCAVTIQNAVIKCLSRPVEYVYDPFIVSLEDESLRLVDFFALILKQTELLAAAQIEAHAQKAAAISASNAKSDFVAHMSHELRTPLTAIIGYAEILLEDAGAAQQPAMVPRIQNIHSAGTHLLEMINGVLDLAKIEARKAELFLTTFSLPEFMRDIVGTVYPLMQKNRNEFELAGGEGIVEMHTDVTKLRQSLLNLLSNAAKFTKDGRIRLAVSRESVEGEDWVVFAVSDTGIGMDESQVSRLFEPFYQADSSISRRYGGTGLGLSLTRHFCTMLGGTLSVESKLNQGTIFTMKVPIRLKEPMADSSALNPA